MADRDIIMDILKDAKKREKLAEKNCEDIILHLKKNGFIDQVEKIKNDEIKHQKIVQQLIDML